jgi:hypothetical protein
MTFDFLSPVSSKFQTQPCKTPSIPQLSHHNPRRRPLQTLGRPPCPIGTQACQPRSLIILPSFGRLLKSSRPVYDHVRLPKSTVAKSARWDQAIRYRVVLYNSVCPTTKQQGVVWSVAHLWADLNLNHWLRTAVRRMGHMPRSWVPTSLKSNLSSSLSLPKHTSPLSSVIKPGCTHWDPPNCPMDARSSLSWPRFSCGGQGP